MQQSSHAAKSSAQQQLLRDCVPCNRPCCIVDAYPLKRVVALAQDCFELGVILLRKKLYTQATKNLEKASRMWDGEPEELAQVHTPAL